MKLNKQPRDDHQMTINVELESERLESAKRRAARHISEHTKIPGFRPGKAPYDIVLRQVGDSKISEEAISLLIDEVYPDVIKEAEIKPGAPGILEKVESIDPPKLVFTIPLEPEIDLGDYSSIRLAYDWKEPGDQDVDSAIDDLRRMYGTMKIVDRPAQIGDFVLVDVTGTKAKADENEKPLIENKSHPLYISSEEKDGEFQFPGFSKKMVGLKKDENKSFTHKYTKEDKNVDLRGQTIKYAVTIKDVREVILPELNDEFAKQVGAFDSVQALHDAIRANLLSRSKSEYDNDYFLRLVDLVKDGAKIKYPPQVLDHELEHVIEDMQGRLAEQNMDLDTYLKSRQTDKEKFIADEAKPVAIRRLERSLILDKLAELEKIEVKEQAFNAAFQQTYNEMQSTYGYQKFIRERNLVPKRVMDAVAMESVVRAKTNETLERLKSIATGQIYNEESSGDSPIAKENKERSSTTKKKPVLRESNSAPKKSKSGKTGPQEK